MTLADITVGYTVAGSPLMARLSPESVKLTCTRVDASTAFFQATYFGVFLGEVRFDSEGVWEWL